MPMIRKTIMWAMIALIGAVVPVACSSDDSDGPDVPDAPQTSTENPLNYSPVQTMWVENLNKYSLKVAQDALSRAPEGENFFVSTLDVMNMYSKLNEHGDLKAYTDDRYLVFGPSGADYGLENLTSTLMSYCSKPQDKSSCSYFASVWADTRIDRKSDDEFAKYLNWVDRSKAYDLFDRPTSQEAFENEMNNWLNKKNPAGCLSFGREEIRAGVHHALAADFHLVPKDPKTTEEHKTDIFYVDKLHQQSFRPLISDYGYAIQIESERWWEVSAVELNDGKSMMYIASFRSGISLKDFALSLTESDLKSWFLETKKPENRCSIHMVPLDISASSTHFSANQLKELVLSEVNNYKVYGVDYPDLAYTASQNVHVVMDGGQDEIEILHYDDWAVSKWFPCVLIVVEKSTNAIQLFGLLYNI